MAGGTDDSLGKVGHDGERTIVFYGQKYLVCLILAIMFEHTISEQKSNERPKDPQMGAYWQ